MFRSASAALAEQSNGTWFMPDEADPHIRTWMAFGASKAIWGAKLLPEVQRNLATIANTVARFEPVSMLVRQNDYALAKKLVSPTVELLVSPLDDLWMRDTGAVFVINEQGEKAAVDFNFNGWGEKQTFSQDAKVAGFIAKRANVRKIATDLILEGGGIEVDGHGSAIITESCVLNSNRNPRVSKAQFEDEISELLGLDKVIWLPGIKGKDITDGHTDFYARFASPSVVLAGYDPDPDSYDHEVTLKHLEILGSATDAQGHKLEILTLEAPVTIRPTYKSNDFAAGYIGFYLCNGAVIAQEFGDKHADNAAMATLRKAFPKREVVQINIDAISAGGGTIHCSTQQEPNA
ncbi:MAG: agmatine deiminase family protein [Methylotenera sp.]